MSDNAERRHAEPAASYVQLIFPVAKNEAPAQVPSPRVRKKMHGKDIPAGAAMRQARHARHAPAAQSDGEISAAEGAFISPAKSFDMGMALSEARRIGAEPSTGLDNQRERFRARGEHATTLGKAIGQAHRADCRTAHREDTKANLFALIPLIKGALTDKGCTW